MKNTFWTKFDNNFFRIKDGVLLQAPIKYDDTVDIDNSDVARSLPANILNKITQEFNSNF